MAELLWLLPHYEMDEDRKAGQDEAAEEVAVDEAHARNLADEPDRFPRRRRRNARSAHDSTARGARKE